MSQHSPEELAKVIMGSSPTIPTDRGLKTVEGLTDMIQQAEHTVDFWCPDNECNTKQTIEGSVEQVLASIQEAGWPICSECGSDMEFET